LAPEPNRYFPPVELRNDSFLSGYVVPALSASASGRVCLAGRCRRFIDAPAYHDHNWGVWRDVTWEWGAAQGTRLDILYGGIYGSRDAAVESSASSPFFLTLVDSLGVRQVLRFSSIRYVGSQPATGSSAATAPTSFSLLGTRESDTLRLEVNVSDALATRMGAGRFRRAFLQMRGQFNLSGVVAGEAVADSGRGFFETWAR
jgi:hypothetical protein